MAQVLKLPVKIFAAMFALTSLSLTAHSRCAGVELHAHRGHFSHPENTVEAVLKAFDEGFDAAEIDIQLLGDKKWVLHHDPVVGRVIKTTGIFPVSSMTSQTWKQASVADRQGGRASEKPAFFEDVLQSTFSPKSGEIQRLNIEIKGKYQCSDIQNAALKLQKSGSTENSFFTSIDLDALSCLRKVDPNKYLGVVIGPEISSVQTRSAPINSLISTLKFQAPEAVRKAEAKYSNTLNRNLLSEYGLKQFKDSFGNVGIHLDASSLAKQPNLLVYAKKNGISVFTYSAQGDLKHAELIRLIRLNTGFLPNGLIIDAESRKMCQAIGNVWG